MKYRVAGALLLGAGCIGAIAPAFADPAGLKLTFGKVVTDPAGAFVSVQVANTGTLTLSQIVVTCQFFAGKTALGSSYTTLFSSFPGITGQDQVRLIGATTANKATCAITTPAS